jgi:hypothetical protein
MCAIKNKNKNIKNKIKCAQQKFIKNKKIEKLFYFLLKCIISKFSYL